MEERNKANGQTTVVAKDEEHLYKLIKEAIAKNGPACDLNFIDVSGINDMRGMFNHSEFNGDISKWDVSNVRHMAGMFRGAKFRGDVSGWNTAKVEEEDGLFDEPSGK